MPEYKILLAQERYREQDITNLINLRHEYVYVTAGKVKVYLRPVDTSDANLRLMTLQKGDFCDPSAPVTDLNSVRQASIN